MDAWRQREQDRRATVLGLPTVRLDHHAALRPVRADDVLVTAAPGPDGDLVAVWAAAEDVSALESVTVQQGWATFPDAQAPQPVAVRVTSHSDAEVRLVAEIPELPLAHPFVQPLPGSQVLIVGARARWRDEGPDRNAIIYGADGQVVTSATLGDGIEHVATTAAGDVWVGYFDEGVYGNYGWGDESVPAPMGACGLARFDTELNSAWRFPSHSDQPWGAVDDCYALNVTGDGVWTCYYSDFPLVRIHDDALTMWSHEVAGARAIMVDPGRVGLFGGYGPDRDRLVLADLAQPKVNVLAHLRVVLPDGGDLPDRFRVYGRGRLLHIIAGDIWYQLDLAATANAL